MPTTIRLTADQVQALDRLRASEHASRAELIRRTMDAFLQAQNGASIAERPGFGTWKKKRVDGVTYSICRNQSAVAICGDGGSSVFI